MIKCNAKIAIRKKKLTELPNKKRELLLQKESRTKKPVIYLKRSPQTPEVVSKTQRNRQEKENWESKVGVKVYERSRSIRSVKNLQTSTKLKPSKMILFLEVKNAHAKQKKYRKGFPTLKVIAYDINKIWLLDLTSVDKYVKEKKDVKLL